jgi:hypothetical protein
MAYGEASSKLRRNDVSIPLHTAIGNSRINL